MLTAKSSKALPFGWSRLETFSPAIQVKWWKWLTCSVTLIIFQGFHEQEGRSRHFYLYWKEGPQAVVSFIKSWPSCGPRKGFDLADTLVRTLVGLHIPQTSSSLNTSQLLWLLIGLKKQSKIVRVHFRESNCGEWLRSPSLKGLLPGALKPVNHTIIISEALAALRCNYHVICNACCVFKTNMTGKES